MHAFKETDLVNKRFNVYMDLAMLLHARSCEPYLKQEFTINIYIYYELLFESTTTPKYNIILN